MKSREYLNQVSVSNIKVRQLQEQLEEVKERMMSVKSPKLDANKVQTSKIDDALAQYAIKCEELEQKIIAEKEYNMSVKDLVIRQIHSLDNPIYINILYQRYVDCYRLEQIAVNENYSYNYTRKLCYKAIRCFANICDMDDKQEKVTKGSQKL